MSRYFAKVRITYTPKNKLHEDLLDIFRVKDRHILDDEAYLQLFLENLHNNISLANSHNPRCKPAKLEEGNKYHDTDDHLSVYIPGLVHMDIWKEESW